MKPTRDPKDELADKLIEVLDKAAMLPEDQASCLADLINLRRGWYHDMLLCYIDEAVLDELGTGAAWRAARRLDFTVYEDDRRQWHVDPPPAEQQPLFDTRRFTRNSWEAR